MVGRREKIFLNGMILRFSFSSGVLALSLLIASVAEARAWRDALAGALKDNEALQQYEAELKSARHNLGLARSRFWQPNINFSAEGGTISEKKPSTGDEFQDETSTSVKATFSKDIYAGGIKKNEISRSKIGVDLAKASLESIEYQVIARGLRAYTDLRYQYLLLSAQIRHQVFSSERLEQIRLGQQGGTRRLIDVWFAQLALQESEQSSLAREALLDQSKAAFSAVFKFDPSPASLTPVDLPVNLLPDSLQKSLTLALERNPVYKVQDLNVAFEKIAIRDASAKAAPVISLRLNAREDSFPNVSVEEETVLSAKIHVDWSLSSTLQTFRERAVAKGRYVASQSEAKNFVLNQRITFERDWNLLHNAARRYNRLAVSERANRELLLSQREEAELGNLIATELLQVELQYLEHRIRFLDAERELFVGYINVLEGAGLLSKDNLGLNL